MTFFPDWETDTAHLREWVHGGGVPTDTLCAELAAWLVRMSESPAHAVQLLGEALARTETPD